MSVVQKHGNKAMRPTDLDTESWWSSDLCKMEAHSPTGTSCCSRSTCASQSRESSKSVSSEDGCHLSHDDKAIHMHISDGVAFLHLRNDALLTSPTSPLSPCSTPPASVIKSSSCSTSRSEVPCTPDTSDRRKRATQLALSILVEPSCKSPNNQLQVPPICVSSRCTRSLSACISPNGAVGVARTDRPASVQHDVQQLHLTCLDASSLSATAVDMDSSHLATLVDKTPTTFFLPKDSPSLGCLITPGAEVLIEGLVKCPAFNGLNGVVEFFDSKTGRYDVLITSTTGEQQIAKIKGENLRLARTSAPPSFVSQGVDDATATTDIGLVLGTTPPLERQVAKIKGENLRPANASAPPSFAPTRVDDVAGSTGNGLVLGTTPPSRSVLLSTSAPLVEECGHALAPPRSFLNLSALV